MKTNELTHYYIVCNMRYVLLSFLIRKRLLSAFCKNIIRHVDTDYHTRSISYLESIGYTINNFTLLKAFTWTNTPEGKYWSTVHDEYLKERKKNDPQFHYVINTYYEK